MGYFILLIIMTMIGACAALFLKKASSSKTIKEILLNYNFYLGGLLYFIGALINIYVLKFLSYSTVLPLISITYIWTMLLSYFILKETISSKKIWGVILIIVGSLVIVM